MGVSAQPRDSRVATPATMFWQFADGDVVPELTIENESARELVFERFGVSSIRELEEHFHPTTRNVDELRLGVVTGDDGDYTFHSESELLAQVEGISEELAEGLVEECQDIPTLCELRRRAGDVFLGDLRHDVDVEDREWAGELEAFVEDLDQTDDLERRLKDAGIWVEPDSATSGI